MAVNPRAEISAESTQNSNVPADSTSKVVLESQPTSIAEDRSYRVAATGDQVPVPEVVLTDSSTHESALQTAAQQIYDKLHPGFLGSADPKTVAGILEAMPKADRVRVEQLYKDLPGNTSHAGLRDDIKGLQAVDYRTVESILDRRDGETNSAGNAKVALEVATKEGDGLIFDSVSEKGTAQLRAVLSILNADNFKQMEETFKARYGQSLEDAVNQNVGLSEADKQLYAYWKKGVDGRTPQDVADMAWIALPTGNLKMLQSVLTGPTGSAAATARQNLMNSPEFMQALEQQFGQYGQESTELKVARDLVREGNISLATIVTGNKDIVGGLLDNKEGTSQALQHASEEERQKFSDGRAAADLLKQNPSATLTPEQTAAKQYYDAISAAFAGYNPREQEILADQIEHGRKTVISNMAERHSEPFIGLFGGGHNVGDLVAAAENMSAEDVALLRDPQKGARFRQEIEQSLATYEPDKANRDRIMAIVDAKMRGEVAQRGIADVLTDNPDASAQSRKNLAEAVIKMSGADIEKYRTDAKFRADLDARFAVRPESTADAAASYLAQSVLKQIAETGAQPVLGPVEEFAQKLMRGQGDVNARTDDAKALIGTSPSLRTHLKELQAQIDAQGPMAQLQFSSMDQNLHSMMSGAFFDNGGLQGQMAYASALKGENTAYYDVLRTGGSAFSNQKLAGLYDDIAKMPESERATRVQFMSPDQRKILDNVMTQGGEPTLPDRLRSYVIGDGGAYGDFKSELSTIGRDPEALRKLTDEYHQKYGGTLSDDFLKTVSSADSIEYKAYFGDQTAQQQYFDRTGQVADSGGFTLDASHLQLDRVLGMNQAQIQQYEAMRQQLPREVQDAIAAQYSASIKNFQDSKQRLADAACDTIFITAALASIPMTGGMSSAALAAMIPELAVAGAASRLTVQAAIRGGDLTTNDALKQAIRGAVEGAIIGIPVGRGATQTEAAAVAPEVVAAERVVAPEVVAAERITATAPEVVAAETATVKEVVATETAVVPEVVAAERITATAPEVVAAETATVKEVVATETAVIPEVVAAERVPVTATAPEVVAAETATVKEVVATETAVVPEVVAAERVPVTATAPEVVAAETATVKEVVATETAVVPEVVAAERVPVTATAPEVVAAETATVKEVVATETAVVPEVVATERVTATAPEVVAAETATVKEVVATETAVVPEVVAAERVTVTATAPEVVAAERVVAEPNVAAPVSIFDGLMERAAQVAAPIVSGAVKAAPVVAAVVATAVDAAGTIPEKEPTEQPVVQAVTTEVVEPLTPVPTEPVEVKELPPLAEPVPNARLQEIATVRLGEGPYQSAARILREATGKRPDHADVMRLTRAIQRVYTAEHDGNGDMSGLKVRYHFVTPENFAKLLQEVQDEPTRQLLRQFIATPQPAA